MNACAVWPSVDANACQRRFHSFSVWIRVKKVITIVVFLVYPSLTVRIFSMFKCVELDQSEFYLQAELSMRCHEGPWLFYSAVAFASIGVYIVGIPVLSFVMLYRHRHVLHDETHPDHERVAKQYGHLYASYEPSMYYWESLEMAKKCMLTGGLILVAPGSSAQILLGTLIALVYLLLVLKSGPYEDDDEDALQFLATLQTLLTLLAGFALKTQSPETGLYEDALMDVLLVLTVVGMFVAGVFAFVVTLPGTKDQMKILSSYSVRKWRRWRSHFSR